MNISYKKTKIALGFLAALSAASVQAANTPTSATASVTVNGAITIAKSADLNFGSIVASYAGTGKAVATLSVSPLEGEATPSAATNDTGDADNAKITLLSQGSPAKFTIAGIGANANVLITTTLGVSDTTLTNGSVPSATALTMATPTIYDVTNSTFKSFNAVTGVSTALTTDGTGALEFNVGATLTVPVGAVATASSVPNGTYSGTFTVVANYQ